MRGRELLRNHSAHRDAEDVRRRPVKKVQHRRCVRGQVGDRERAFDIGALADAAMVVGNDVEVAPRAA
jgi:hypothetical protein